MAEPAGPLPVSFEERMKVFDSIPLFMRTLPSEEDQKNDVTLSALQSLMDEGTPDENAQAFKENGNDYFKGRRFREAASFYTQGIDAKPTDPSLLEALFCNRAACNLELKNYGSVLRDCSQAIDINPKSAKAYYRSAMALIAVERFEEALDCCDRCLAFDPHNAGVTATRQRALDGKEKAERKAREREEREKKEKEEARLLQLALRERGVIVVSKAAHDAPCRPHFAPPAPPHDTLVIPVWLVYPQHGVSDLIAEFHEDSVLGDHLDVMFPPQGAPQPFDPAGSLYNSANLVVYVQTRRKRILKVGRNMTLYKLFEAARPKAGDPPDGLEMKEGCLTLVVLPKGEVEKKWVEEAKRTRDGVKS